MRTIVSSSRTLIIILLSIFSLTTVTLYAQSDSTKAKTTTTIKSTALATGGKYFRNFNPDTLDYTEQVDPNVESVYYEIETDSAGRVVKVNGVISGTVILTFEVTQEDGMTVLTQYNSEGKKEGRVIYFDSQNNLKLKEEFYVNDKLSYTIKYVYNDKGKLKRKESYNTENEKDGWWVYYNDDCESEDYNDCVISYEYYEKDRLHDSRGKDVKPEDRKTVTTLFNNVVSEDIKLTIDSGVINAIDIDFILGGSTSGFSQKFDINFLDTIRFLFYNTKEDPNFQSANSKADYTLLFKPIKILGTILDVKLPEVLDKFTIYTGNGIFYSSNLSLTKEIKDFYNLLEAGKPISIFFYSNSAKEGAFIESLFTRSRWEYFGVGTESHIFQSENMALYGGLYFEFLGDNTDIPSNSALKKLVPGMDFSGYAFLEGRYLFYDVTEDVPTGNLFHSAYGKLTAQWTNGHFDLSTDFILDNFNIFYFSGELGLENVKNHMFANVRASFFNYIFDTDELFNALDAHVEIGWKRNFLSNLFGLSLEAGYANVTLFFTSYNNTSGTVQTYERVTNQRLQILPILSIYPFSFVDLYSFSIQIKIGIQLYQDTDHVFDYAFYAGELGYEYEGFIQTGIAYSMGLTLRFEF